MMLRVSIKDCWFLKSGSEKKKSHAMSLSTRGWRTHTIQAESEAVKVCQDQEERNNMSSPK